MKRAQKDHYRRTCFVRDPKVTYGRRYVLPSSYRKYRFGSRAVQRVSGYFFNWIFFSLCLLFSFLPESRKEIRGWRQEDEEEVSAVESKIVSRACELARSSGVCVRSSVTAEISGGGSVHRPVPNRRPIREAKVAR